MSEPRLIDETIRWHSVDVELPDPDTTVLLYAPTADEPVWLGWYDGAFWFAVDAMEYEDGAVKAWAYLPAGAVP